MHAICSKLFDTTKVYPMTTPDNTYRGTGRTTQQMLEAPIGAVYIWSRHDLHYPKHLARHLQREDLKIVSTDWLIDEKWRGLELSGICVDHAVWGRMNSRLHDALDNAMTRVRS